MLKKILIGVGLLAVVIIAALFYMNNRNRTLSPPGQAALENDGLSVAIDYSRPSVRDRLIFGEEAEGALLPYGVYWRLGANEPTGIEVSADFLFGDKEIPAGEYEIYAIPRKGEMEIHLSSDSRIWGYSEPNYELDLGVTLVRMERSDKTEQFTIETNAMQGGIDVVFKWDVYSWSLPLKKK